MKFDLRRALAAVLPLVPLLLNMGVPGFAQTSTMLSGTVTDPSDAAVPGATVTLTNKTTGAVRTDTADHVGAFTFPQLQPGLYDLKAEKTGFKTIVSQPM